MHEPDTLSFLNPALARQIRQDFGSPLHILDEATLRRQAQAALAFPQAFGLVVRYAMKANPTAAVLRIFDQEGLHIDASSGFEVRRALQAGIAPEKISLSSQESASDLEELLALGVKFNATSLNQLEQFAAGGLSAPLGLRVNPGLGSGGTNRTNVGGPASSFGIWHEQLDRVLDIVETKGLRVERIHTHIGSGSEPSVWQKVARMSLDVVRRFPEVDTLDLGGGFKVARMRDEAGTCLQAAGEPVKQALERFAEETGRKLRLEIEPGTFLVANAGALLASVQDVCSTGAEGYDFLKLDTGMTELLRPSLYGAQHPIVVVPACEPAEDRELKPCLVVGHCCESGDIFTPAPGDPEGLAPRNLLAAQLGDMAVIEGAGAYAAAMSAKNYNSFPEAGEVLVDHDGEARLIRRRQTLEQMLQNEC